MDNLLFNLKFTGKQFDKASKKAEKEEAAQKKKCKQAMEKGNLDGARIYAQNAIRKHNESINYLRLSSRMDAVSARVNTALKMKQVSGQMGKVVKGMDKILATMDPEKIAKVMDKFETDLENLDVTTEYMEGAIGSSTSLTTPEDQVTGLMAEIIDENNMNLQIDINNTTIGHKDPVAEQQQDDLAQRLAALKEAKTAPGA
eukprot:TRINITY_DN66859_c14_g4_i1.p2 TRINITY_DN66859_c14_g4~~TRINITY_DN66859_c14_g4_i1.p2  ORF type:complete len:201 (-),score=57.09 TRINITY_DN66859_c14_g4_i1:1858-2460(-)